MDKEQKQLMEAILNQLKKMNETLEKHLDIMDEDEWNMIHGVGPIDAKNHIKQINNRMNLND